MNFLRVAGRDIKSIFKNRFIRVSVTAIIIVPLLYSLLYLYAFWDPYSHLQDMPVAVVNMDSGSTKDGVKANYGKDIVNKLKDDTRMGWKFVSYDQAKKGLNGKNGYYAMFVIPENFSKDILSAKDGKPIQPKIIYSSNDKKNFIGSQINGKVAIELKAEIIKSITKEYTKVTFENLYDVKDGFNQASDGSKKLYDGLSDAKYGSSQIKDGIGQIKDKVPEMEQGVSKLYNGSKQLSDGITTTAIDSSGKPLGLRNGVSKLAGGLDSAKTAAGQLNVGASQLYDGLKQVGGGLSTLNTALNGQSNNQIGLATALKMINDGVTDPDPNKGLGAGVAALNKAVNVDVDGNHPSLKTGVSALYDGITNANPTKGLGAGVNLLYNAMTKGVTDSTGIAIPSLSKSVSDLSTSTNQLNDLVTAYNSAKDPTQKSAYLSAIFSGISNLNIGAQKLNAGVNTGTSGMPSLSASVTSLNTAVNVGTPSKPSLVAGITSVNDGVTKQLSPAVGALDSSVNGVNGINPLTNQPSLTAGISTMYNSAKGSINALANGVGQLNAAVNTGYNGHPSLLAGMNSLKDGTGQLVPGMDQASSASQGILAGANSLADGSTQLKDGLSTLNSSIPQLADGANKLYDGSSSLDDGISKLKDGANELYTKLKDGADKINKNLVNSADVMGDYVSQPIALDEQPINSVKNYGTGFAPYFIPLSLWVGAIMMFFIISDKVDSDLNVSSASLVAGKFLSYGYIGILQATLASLVVLALGLKPNNIVMFFVFNIFMSYVFIAIIQSLVFLLGMAGRLLSIVLLILQLTSCAGTFPLEVVPKFFKVLYPFMPFTYCVSALREIVSGSNHTIIAQDMTILALVLAVFLTISIIFKGHADRMQEIIEKKKIEEQAIV